MKDVILLRHAKAEPLGSFPSDFDRPLAARGHEDARRVGQALAAMKLVPDAIVTSPARRAKETAVDVAEAMGFEKAIREDRVLYDSPGPKWLAVVSRFPASADVGLLVAHNPGIEELAAVLAGAPVAFLDCPTAGLIGFQSDATTWKSLASHGAALRWFLRPKLIEALTG
jgi:phosphohistidine phosphatase